MTWLQSPRSKYSAVAVGSAVLGFLVAWPVFATGQNTKDLAADPAAKHAVPADKTADANKELADQIRQLNTRVARLEAAPKQDLQATPLGAPDKGGQAGKPAKVEGVPPGKGGPADKAEGVPPGKRISAKFQNCAECHQKRPSGPLPPSHLELAASGDMGVKQDDKTGTGDNKTPAADPAAKHAVPADKTADASKELADQIRQLNAKVARLEAALNQDPKATPSGAPDGTGDNKTPADGKAGMSDKGMGMMGGKGMGMMGGKGMGMMGGKDMGMGMMDEKKGAGMGMMAEKKGMPGMGEGKAGMGMMEEKKGAGMSMMAEKKGMSGTGGGKTGTSGSTTGTMDQLKMQMLELKMQMLELKMEMLEKGATGTDQTAPETGPAPHAAPHVGHTGTPPGMPDENAKGGVPDKTPDLGKLTDKSADADKDLLAQVRELQARIAQLEGASKQGPK